MLKKRLIKKIDSFLNDDSSDFIESIRGELTDFFLFLVSLFVLIPLSSSLYRSLDIGWQPLFTFHIVIVSLLYVILFARKLIATRVKALVLVAMFFLAGVAGYLQLGLLSHGALLFTVALIFSLLLLGLRYFISLSILSTLAIVLSGLWSADAYIVSGIDADVYLQSSSTWILSVLSFIFLMVTVLAGVGYVLTVINKLLREIKIKNAMNKKLLLERDEFFSNVSHELRTPLNAILGFSSILNRNLKDEEHLKLSNYIYDNSSILLKLINEILDLSMIKDSQFEVDMNKFNAYDEIEIFSHQLQGLTAQKFLKYDLNINESLKNTFYGDWSRINQIILNLVSNSIKFAKKNGGLTLKFDHKNGEFIFMIKNDGVAVDDFTKDKIFKPFVQVNGTRTRQQGGTGLGLTITQNLINVMGGSISVQSQEDKGTAFEVRIPLKMLPKNAREEKRKEKEFVPKEPFNLHALVAEDNETNQILIEMLLDDIGITCDIANDGLEAVEMYDPAKHAFILMDENMPNMNGVDAMLCIREKYKDECTPIIALTANAMNGDKERYLESGMDGYVSKPVEDDLLYNEIQRCVRE